MLSLKTKRGKDLFVFDLSSIAAVTEEDARSCTIFMGDFPIDVYGTAQDIVKLIEATKKEATDATAKDIMASIERSIAQSPISEAIEDVQVIPVGPGADLGEIMSKIMGREGVDDILGEASGDDKPDASAKPKPH